MTTVDPGLIDADKFGALCNLFCLAHCDSDTELTAEQAGDVLYYRANPMTCDHARLMTRAVLAYLGIRTGIPEADELINEVGAAMRNGKGSLPDGENES